MIQRRRRRRSTRPRDSQRQAVYEWEKRAKCWEIDAQKITPMSRKEIEKLVHRLWTGYVGDDNVPKVSRCHGRRGRACYKTLAHEVIFPKWACQPGMLAHEVAHAILYKKAEGYIKTHDGLRKIVLAAHGPEFVRVYCELLVSLLGFDPKVLTREMSTGKRRKSLAQIETLDIPD